MVGFDANLLKNCMRQYIADNNNVADAFKVMKQLIHELEDEANEDEADVWE
jgi:hypothetical protein